MPAGSTHTTPDSSVQYEHLGLSIFFYPGEKPCLFVINA